MHQTVFGLHEAVHAARELQRTDHLQRIERKLLEELARALGIRAHTGEPGAGARAARQERRAQLGCRVDVGLIRLDLGQRLDAPARLFLRVLDEARQLIVCARAGAEPQVCGANERGAETQRQPHGVAGTGFTELELHVDLPAKECPLLPQPGGRGWWVSFLLSASPAAISPSSR